MVHSPNLKVKNMFFNKERQVITRCTNKECKYNTSDLIFGVQHIYEEDISEVLVCPQCGKKIKILEIKLFKKGK